MAESMSETKKMKINLCVPKINKVVSLRWTADHPASNYGLGVLLTDIDDAILDGVNFARMVDLLGAWIETDSEATSRRVHNALCTGATGREYAVKVVGSLFSPTVRH